MYVFNKFKSQVKIKIIFWSHFFVHSMICITCMKIFLDVFVRNSIMAICKKMRPHRVLCMHDVVADIMYGSYGNTGCEISSR